MIGYNLSHYNPCVDFNKDAFCGTPQEAAMLENIEQRKPARTPATTFNAPRNGAFPNPYTFTPISDWSFRCDRDPIHLKSCNKAAPKK